MARMSELRGGEVDIGCGHPGSGVSFRKIGNILLDADLDLRGKLSIQLKRGRAADWQILDTRTQPGIRQFVGSIRDLAAGIDL
jgi:hypothetical protein|tara:strand:+ start:438 stop:686 length:249 start_codon:yes stop_codon:yes gene_type:complete